MLKAHAALEFSIPNELENEWIRGFVFHSNDFTIRFPKVSPDPDMLIHFGS